jgi:CRISPR-associated protein Cmr3
MLSKTRKNTVKFTHLIIIQPLGFLYGSAGKFLSPENLVGRSGTSFPPSSAVLSGVFAYYHQQNQDTFNLNLLHLAGPFWAENNNPQNFYVPTPFNCLVKKGTNQISDLLTWNGTEWLNQKSEQVTGKFPKGTWTNISDWHKFNWLNKTVWMKSEEEDDNHSNNYEPWQFLPHLHPRMDTEQRTVNKDVSQGSLFLENAVQLDPDICLIYLSNTPIKDGWYRFGGESHIVEITCEPLSIQTQELLNLPVGKNFALITPGVWGSNRLSQRQPINLETGNPEKYQQENPEKNEIKNWQLETLMTERAIPFRYRLGNNQNHQNNPHIPKLLSRGRYAVPAGTVYVLEKEINQSWQEWPEDWFPKEGPSLKRWGCGLALPLENVC